MKPKLPLSSEPTLGKIVQFGRQAPAGLENLPHSTLIRMFRTDQSLTQAQLAQKAGIPQSHLASLEKDKMVPQLKTLKKIFRALSFHLIIVPKPTTKEFPSAKKQTPQSSSVPKPIKSPGQQIEIEDTSYF